MKSAGAVAAGAAALQLGSTADASGLISGRHSQAPREDAALGFAPPNSFSIFWITDTQFLSEANPALYRMMTAWISRNWEAYNGKLVVHTGDIVQKGSDPSQWHNAHEAMSTLLEARIPYTWCAGNHDDLVQNDSTSGWIGRESASSVDPVTVGPMVNGSGYARWVGDYHDGMNTAVSFAANGMNFLVVNLEWNAGTDALAWAEGLLDHPDLSEHHVIVAPHAYIDYAGSTNNITWVDPTTTFIRGLTKMLNDHSSQVFLTLNGHYPTECGYNTPRMVGGRNELMFDRQDCADTAGAPTGRGADDDTTRDSDRVGGATVTILTFMHDHNLIAVRTFDIYKGEWRTHPTEEYGIDMFPGPSTSPGVHPETGVVTDVTLATAH